MLRLLAGSLLLVATPALAQGPPPVRDGAFVSVDGTRFVADGNAFHVVGANVAVMHGRTQREHARATLEAAAADGLSLVRVWALGEYPSDAPSWTRDYAFRVGPDGWIDATYAHLDQVLVDARRLGLRVVIVLANRWGDYGGIPAYLRWEGQEPARHPPPLALTAFWECASCEARYREHVRRLVTRVNPLTGLAYADDPTIFAWELMNEAEAAGSIGEAAMIAWIDRQARFVRTLDARHMISAGHIGYARLRDRALWTRACSLESISYCDSHAYPLRPGRVETEARLLRWIDDRVQLAHHVAAKPLLFGELGVPGDRRRVHGRPRAAWLRTFFRRVIANGASGGLLWTYLPSTENPRTYAIYAHGDREGATADLRRAIAGVARLATRRPPRASNRRVSAALGDTLLDDPRVTLRGPRTIHGAGEAEVVVDPLAFERARFEAAGAFAGEGAIPHFHGSGAGTVTYLVRRPALDGEHRTLTIRLRASSELPGSSGGASEADTSVLTVAMDGVELGALTAPPDDGVGAWLELVVDAAMIPERAVHRLEIRAGDAAAGGVCLYGTTEAGEPAGITVTWGP